MAILKSEAPDPEEFVRKQISNHVGRDVYDLDDQTIISGSVVVDIMEALDEVIQPKKPANTDSLRLDARYTMAQCISIVRFRINGQCKVGPAAEWLLDD